MESEGQTDDEVAEILKAAKHKPLRRPVSTRSPMGRSSSPFRPRSNSPGPRFKTSSVKGGYDPRSESPNDWTLSEIGGPQSEAVSFHCN